MMSPTAIAANAEPNTTAITMPPGPTVLSIFIHVSSPAVFVIQRFPAAQVDRRVVVATQLPVVPDVTKQNDVWTVFVVEQRRVPVVVTAPVLVVEELELVSVEDEDVVEDAVVADVGDEVFESDVVESDVVDAAALEGAVVLEAAAEDSVVLADLVLSVALSVVFSSVVFSSVVFAAESELVSDESALFLKSCRSSSFRASAWYLCANHTDPTLASDFEHPPAI